MKLVKVILIIALKIQQCIAKIAYFIFLCNTYILTIDTRYELCIAFKKFPRAICHQRALVATQVHFRDTKSKFVNIRNHLVFSNYLYTQKKYKTPLSDPSTSNGFQTNTS